MIQHPSPAYEIFALTMLMQSMRYVATIKHLSWCEALSMYIGFGAAADGRQRHFRGGKGG